MEYNWLSNLHLRIYWMRRLVIWQWRWGIGIIRIWIHGVLWGSVKSLLSLIIRIMLLRCIVVGLMEEVYPCQEVLHCLKWKKKGKRVHLFNTYEFNLLFICCECLRINIHFINNHSIIITLAFCYFFVYFSSHFGYGFSLFSQQQVHMILVSNLVCNISSNFKDYWN